MMRAARDLLLWRELLFTLAWKNIALRYKQAYLGIAWAVLKPLMLMLVFTLVRSVVGIDSGELPYPLLVFAALVPWIFFQEAATDTVGSVVTNAALIRKIHFPREILPLTAVATKLVEMLVNLAMLLALMAWFGLAPGVQALWVPLLVAYTVLVALAIGFLGAAINVYYRDAGQALPVLLGLLMYASPVIYPLQLVRERLLAEPVAESSAWLWHLYTLNPLAGVIDAFQNTLLRGKPPDLEALAPGALVVALVLPLSWAFFKRAERHFADVI